MSESSRKNLKTIAAGKVRPGGGRLPGEVIRLFMSRRDPDRAGELRRFFKTGSGQYGEGDCFLGIAVPAVRSLIRPYSPRLTLTGCRELLASPWHEIRLAALLVLAERAEKMARDGDAEGLRELVGFYDRHLERANNWDLVDLSVCGVMGAYWRLLAPPAREIRKFLKGWADSGNLWRERAAMASTLARQRQGSLAETFWLARRFLNHPHDLMHKVCGWMLREAGKRDLAALRSFLADFRARLPRTTLRYAIERLDAAERSRWLAR